MVNSKLDIIGTKIQACQRSMFSRIKGCKTQNGIKIIRAYKQSLKGEGKKRISKIAHNNRKMQSIVRGNGVLIIKC